MCIRDSLKYILESAKNYQDLLKQAREKSTEAGTIDQLWICLLYTSDAADERSSVDLGGRRIIKKKNSRGDREGGGMSMKNTDGRVKRKRHIWIQR